MTFRNNLFALLAGGGLSLACGSATLTAASDIIVPTTGYQAQDAFTSHTFGGFAAGPNGSMLGWNSSAGLVLLSGGSTFNLGAPADGYVVEFNSFVRYNSTFTKAMVGFTVGGGLNDRLYEVDLSGGPGSATWTHLSTFAGNQDAVYRGDNIFVSGTNEAGFGGSNGLWLLDPTTSGPEHSLLLDVGGYAAGIAVDGSGGIYMITSFADGGDKLLFLSGESIDRFLSGETLSMTDAQIIAALGGTGADVDVAPDGMVYFTVDGALAELWAYNPGDGSLNLLGERDDAMADWGAYLGTVSGVDGGVYVATYDEMGLALVTAVPEPGATGLLALGAVLILFSRRRR